MFIYCHKIEKCHKINPNHIQILLTGKKKKKATINPINKKDNKCFQYATTVMLNHFKIGKNSERITKMKPFINKYN